MLEYTFVSVAVILILTSGGDKYLLSLTNLSFLWGPFTNIMHWWINCFKTRTTLSNRVDPSCSLGGSWISPKSRSGLLTHLPPLSSRCLGYLLVPRKTPDRWWWLKLRALQKQKPFFYLGSNPLKSPCANFRRHSRWVPSSLQNIGDFGAAVNRGRMI